MSPLFTRVTTGGADFGRRARGANANAGSHGAKAALGFAVLLALAGVAHETQDEVIRGRGGSDQRRRGQRLFGVSRRFSRRRTRCNEGRSNYNWPLRWDMKVTFASNVHNLDPGSTLCSACYE